MMVTEKNKNLTPIVLFVYNRLSHTMKTLEALQDNFDAERSNLYIYSDAARDELSLKKVEEVRAYIKNFKDFKKIEIIERPENFGLAQSITSGVTEIINDYGKVIVLEDDIVTSPYFLNFMNKALDYYAEHKNVWHVSGWNYPIHDEVQQDYFFMHVMNCWGWGTWKDRWKNFNLDKKDDIYSWDKVKIKEFDLDNSGIFWNQVIANKNKKINTWAVFWYATIFASEGLCLNPSQSFVKNIGFDGSGTNCGEENNQLNIELNQKDIEFSNNIFKNEIAINEIKKFFLKKKIIFYQNL